MNFFKETEGRLKHCPIADCYPTSIYIPRKKVITPRIVPPFSIQALRQKNVIVQPYQKTSPVKPYPVGNSAFKKHYVRGDFPIALEFDNFGQRISWKVTPSQLDYTYYLPLFFDGLCEVEHPYHFFAEQGIRDLLLNGKKKILPVIPQLILPIKNALNTKNRIVIATTLKMLQHLVTCTEAIGEALVPYYRQILPPLNLYKTMYVNTGDDIDYSQQKRENIGELVEETLETLEMFGGKDAFINIKYMIPTYESCVRNQ